MKFPGLDDSLMLQLLLASARIEGNPFARVEALQIARQAGAVIPHQELFAAFKAAAEAGNWYSDDVPFGSNETFAYLRVASEMGDPTATIEIGKIAAAGMTKLLPQEAAQSFLERAIYLSTRPSSTYGAANKSLAEALETGIGVEARDDVAANNRWKAYASSLHWSYSNDPDVKKTGPQSQVAKALGDLAFDDAGRDFAYPDEPWGVARIWWKKAIGARRAHDPRIMLEDRTASDDCDDQTVAEAFNRLAYLSYHGLGVDESRATAFAIWRWTARLSTQSRMSGLKVLEKYALAAESLPDATPEQKNAKQAAQRIRRRYVEAFKQSYPVEGDTVWAIWTRAVETPPTTIKDRLAIYQDLAAKGDWMGTVALALAQTLFVGPTELSQQMLVSTAERTRQVPAPIVALFRDMQRLKGAGQAYALMRSELSDKQAKLYRVTPEAPKALIEAVKANRLQPEIRTLEWCDLRGYLAEVAQEPSAPWWKELNSRLQAKSSMLLGRLNRGARTKDLLLTMPGVIEQMTLDIGSVLNEIDADGFPIPMTRARIEKGPFGWIAEKGWDRVDEIKLTPDGIDVVGERTSKGLVPLVTLKALEEVLSIALVEIPQRPLLADGTPDDDLTFSLEPLDEAHLAPVRLRFYRRQMGQSPWINGTVFGRAKYYTDCLLFIDETGRQVFSTTDPYLSRDTHQVGWRQPQPWRRASFGGGITASPVSRNASNTKHGIEEERPSKQFPYQLKLPRVLRHVDGSEIVFAQDGSELHRNGGRDPVSGQGSLHYKAIRHASILSAEIPLMAEQFPVIGRTMQLERVYSGLRMAIGNDVDWLRDSKLYRKLERVREKAIANWERNGQSAGVVVAH